MEGDEVFASIDSLWFYSSVFLSLKPSSKRKQSGCPEERQLRQPQDSAAARRTSSDSSCRAPERVKEAAAAATERRAAAAAAAAARSSRASGERVDVWLKMQMQGRGARVVDVPARCSPASMPPHGDGLAMKAHLRSWAHAVACSVR